LGYNPPAFQGAKRTKAMLRALRKPIRTILIWQVAATAMIAMAAVFVADIAGALSAAAGGAVSILAGLASALVASLGDAKSAGAALAGALRAEAVRIGLAFALAWLVLANYPGTAVAAFLGALVVTMVIFSMAFFVREY
jgi:F0F1-type ATP synthase assembly protein I